MNKVLAAVTLSGAILLSGCVRDLPLESTISLEVDFPTEPLKEIAFSKWNMEDFRFETTSSVQENGVYARYSGEIVDEEIKSQLWDILCRQEQMGTYQGGSWGGGMELRLTDRRTGESFTAGYTIWYETSEVEGGPACFVISGASCGTACYYPIDKDTDPEIYASNRFEALLAEGVKREENLIAQKELETDVFFTGTIVLAEVYSNWADGFDYYGTVIDLEGNVFSFDFSDDPDQAILWEEAGLLLYEKYENAELDHVGNVDKDMIWECWMLGDALDPDAPMPREHVAYDAGQRTLCLFDMDTGALIPISSSGNWKSELLDENAQKIMELYQSLYG